MSIKIPYVTYLPVILAVILVLFVYLAGSNIPQETIRQFIKGAGPLGILVFILLTWSTFVIAPLSGAPFLFAGYYLFGQNVIIYTTVAAWIASITNFLIAKRFGRRLVVKLAGPDGLKKVDELTIDYGLPALFITRICLVHFHDVVSYAFGLTRLKFVPYIAVSTLGLIPGTVIWYFLSSKVHDPIRFFGLSLILGYIFLSLYLIGRKLTKKKKLI